MSLKNDVRLSGRIEKEESLLSDLSESLSDSPRGPSLVAQGVSTGTSRSNNDSNDDDDDSDIESESDSLSTSHSPRSHSVGIENVSGVRGVPDDEGEKSPTYSAELDLSSTSKSSSSSLSAPNSVPSISASSDSESDEQAANSSGKETTDVVVSARNSASESEGSGRSQSLVGNNNSEKKTKSSSEDSSSRGLVASVSSASTQGSSSGREKSNKTSSSSSSDESIEDEDQGLESDASSSLDEDAVAAALARAERRAEKSNPAVEPAKDLPIELSSAARPPPEVPVTPELGSLEDSETSASGSTSPNGTVASGRPADVPTPVLSRRPPTGTSGTGEETQQAVSPPSSRNSSTSLSLEQQASLDAPPPVPPVSAANEPPALPPLSSASDFKSAVAAVDEAAALDGTPPSLPTEDFDVRGSRHQSTSSKGSRALRDRERRRVASSRNQSSTSGGSVPKKPVAMANPETAGGRRVKEIEQVSVGTSVFRVLKGSVGVRSSSAQFVGHLSAQPGVTVPLRPSMWHPRDCDDCGAPVDLALLARESFPRIGDLDLQVTGGVPPKLRCRPDAVGELLLLDDRRQSWQRYWAVLAGQHLALYESRLASFGAAEPVTVVHLGPHCTIQFFRDPATATTSDSSVSGEDLDGAEFRNLPIASLVKDASGTAAPMGCFVRVDGGSRPWIMQFGGHREGPLWFRALSAACDRRTGPLCSRCRQFVDFGAPLDLLGDDGAAAALRAHELSPDQLDRLPCGHLTWIIDGDQDQAVFAVLWRAHLALYSSEAEWLAWLGREPGSVHRHPLALIHVHQASIIKRGGQSFEVRESWPEWDPDRADAGGAIRMVSPQSSAERRRHSVFLSAESVDVATRWGKTLKKHSRDHDKVRGLPAPVFPRSTAAANATHDRPKQTASRSRRSPRTPRSDTLSPRLDDAPAPPALTSASRPKVCQKCQKGVAVAKITTNQWGTKWFCDPCCAIVTRRLLEREDEEQGRTQKRDVGDRIRSPRSGTGKKMSELSASGGGDTTGGGRRSKRRPAADRKTSRRQADVDADAEQELAALVSGFVGDQSAENGDTASTAAAATTAGHHRSSKKGRGGDSRSKKVKSAPSKRDRGQLRTKSGGEGQDAANEPDNDDDSLGEIQPPMRSIRVTQSRRGPPPLLSPTNTSATGVTAKDVAGLWFYINTDGFQRPFPTDVARRLEAAYRQRNWFQELTVTKLTYVVMHGPDDIRVFRRGGQDVLGVIVERESDGGAQRASPWPTALPPKPPPTEPGRLEDSIDGRKKGTPAAMATLDRHRVTSKGGVLVAEVVQDATDQEVELEVDLFTPRVDETAEPGERTISVQVHGVPATQAIRLVLLKEMTYDDLLASCRRATRRNFKLSADTQGWQINVCHAESGETIGCLGQVGSMLPLQTDAQLRQDQVDFFYCFMPPGRTEAAVRPNKSNDDQGSTESSSSSWSDGDTNFESFFESGDFESALRQANRQLRSLARRAADGERGAETSQQQRQQRRLLAAETASYKVASTLLLAVRRHREAQVVVSHLTTFLALLPLPRLEHRLACVRIAVRRSAEAGNWAASAMALKLLKKLLVELDMYHGEERDAVQSQLALCKKNEFKNEAPFVGGPPSDVWVPSKFCARSFLPIVSAQEMPDGATASCSCSVCQSSFLLGKPRGSVVSGLEPLKPGSPCPVCFQGVVTSPSNVGRV